MRDDGSFVATWTDFRDLEVRLYDASGSPLTDDISVAERGFDPALVTRGNGDFLVLWSEDPHPGRPPSQILGRRFAADAAFASSSQNPDTRGIRGQRFRTSSAGSADTDRDGIADGVDNCPSVPNEDQLDVAGDGYGDACVCRMWSSRPARA
jgi:hypothetical protein